eukprot:s2755_g11.t1
MTSDLFAWRFAVGIGNLCAAQSWCCQLPCILSLCQWTSIFCFAIGPQYQQCRCNTSAKGSKLKIRFVGPISWLNWLSCAMKRHQHLWCSHCNQLLNHNAAMRSNK